MNQHHDSGTVAAVFLGSISCGRVCCNKIQFSFLSLRFRAVHDMWSECVMVVCSEVLAGFSVYSGSVSQILEINFTGLENFKSPYFAIIRLLSLFLLGCQYGNPSRKMGIFLRCFIFTGFPVWQYQSPANQPPASITSQYHIIFFSFFSRVGKSLACHFPGKWCLCA